MEKIVSDGSWMVEYFEIGCRCIDSNKIKKADEDLSNANKLEYYMEHCSCTRHPESKNRYCWDRRPKKAS